LSQEATPANGFAGGLKKARRMGRDEQEDFKKNGSQLYIYNWSSTIIYIFLTGARRPLDPSERVVEKDIMSWQKFKKAE
jgi:hypothetical protein